ncbi:hypothetical protein [Legionella maceachernii]|uniref:Uncharacterized protein n=1 Tax=Legionella maceachernii TaxID=466 RepID=A0A0W0WFK9_9GAMM|nr:hypothetical protein [Legionella maceachernii]KTD31132.1 hypothetical protein Lmac_0435 [Legionella maceachernii]SJZ99422.1 hypothetical protein SAMN02745128_01703 [Legionella maceachernii]SUP01256.1 Uncharacterised protein [Legionella maceachernii]
MPKISVLKANPKLGELKKYIDLAKLGNNVEIKATEDAIVDDNNKKAIIDIAEALSKAGKLTKSNLQKVLELASQPQKLAKLQEVMALDAKLKGVNVDKFLSMSEQRLDHIKSILAKIPKGESIDNKTFNHLMDGFKDGENERVGALGNCIAAMKSADIPMSRFWRGNNVERIAQLPENQLIAVSAVLKGLTTPPRKALDERTFNYIVDNPKHFAEPVGKSTKGAAIVAAFTAMDEAHIPIVGNRQPIMNMDGNHLVKLAAVLPQFDFLKPKRRLSPTQFNWLREHVGQLEEGQIPHFGQCVRAMDGKVPLVSVAGHNRLIELMGKGKDLEGIGKIVESLGDRLDEKTFDYVLKESPRLAPKAAKIADVFKAMKETANMDLEGLRQPVMDIVNAKDTEGKDVKVLEALKEVVGQLAVPKDKPPLLDKSACKNLIDKLVKDSKNPEKEPWTKDRAQDLGKCFRAMQANDISLTPFLRAENPSRLMDLKPNELKAVGNLLTTLSNYKALDKKTFDYIVDNAPDLAVGAIGKTKADEVVAVFKAMDDFGISIEGNRQPIMEMAKSNPGSLSVLKSVLEKSNQPPKVALDDKAFKDLRSNIQHLHLDQVDSLMTCLRAMNAQTPKIALTSSVPLMEGHLAQLVKLGTQDGAGNKLQELAKIVTSLAKEMDEKTFEYLVKNADELTKDNKAKRIADVFDGMRELKIDLEGDRQPVMKMEDKDLDKLKVILNAAAAPKEGKQPLPINKDTFKMMREGVKDFDKEAVDSLASCIAAMNKGNVPVQHQVIGNRIGDLMKVGANPAHLAGVAKILQSIAGKEGQSSALNDKTFDYVVKNAPALADKAGHITSAFDAMRTARINIAGHRQPLMKLAMKGKEGVAELQKLTAFLGQLKAPTDIKEPLGKDEFKALQTHVKKLDDTKAKPFAGCINALRASRIPLTESLPLKEDRLAKLLARSKDELETVNKLLGKLSYHPKGSNLNKATFDYIVEHAKELNEPVDEKKPDGEKKVDRVLKVFTAMGELDIPIKGNRQPIMKMDNKELDNLAKVLAEFKKTDVPMNKDDFKVLRKNVSKLKDWDDNQIKHFGQCVGAMNGKVPFSTLLDDRLGRLMALDTGKKEGDETKLATVAKIFEAVGGELNKDIFDHVVDNVANGKLKDEAHVQSLINCIQAMNDNGIPLTQFIGSDRLANLMQLSKGNLQKVESIMTTLNEHGALNKKTLDYLVDNAAKWSDKKTEKIKQLFELMGDNHIEIKGNRQPLMKLGETQLQSMIDRLNKTKELGGQVTDTQFKQLLKKEAKSAPVEEVLPRAEQSAAQVVQSKTT